jgi:diguanylate cyclase (GGDEF)-like protein
VIEGARTKRLEKIDMRARLAELFALQAEGWVRSDPANRDKANAFRAQVLASLWLLSSTLAVIAIAMPQQKRVDVTGDFTVAILGYLSAGLIFLLGRKMNSWLTHVFLLGGTVAVSLGIYFGHGSYTSVAAGALYVLVAIYSAFFFSWRGGIFHLSMIALCFAVALSFNVRARDTVAAAVLVFGITAAAMFVVGYLAQEIRRVASTDTLTGLPNRQALAQKLEIEVSRAQRYRTRLAVAIVDLDDFKEVNDQRGHHAGDRLLAELARAWRGALRCEDLLARWGGDEFVVVLPSCGAEEAETVCSRLQKSGGQSCSIGIAVHGPGEDAETLLVKADRALYEAKAAGRNKIVVANND